MTTGRGQDGTKKGGVLGEESSTSFQPQGLQNLSLWILERPVPSLGLLPMASSSLVSHHELTSHCCTHSHAPVYLSLPLLKGTLYKLNSTLCFPHTTHASLPTSNRSSRGLDHISQNISLNICLCHSAGNCHF